MKKALRIWGTGAMLFLASSMPAQKVCDVRTYGAKGDGTTKDTLAIQHAIDDCSNAGTGIVRIAGAAVFVSGPLDLKSNITLETAAGTTLAASSDHNDFPEMEELRGRGRRPLLNADNAENITIKGGGTIDGRGETWWPHVAQGYTRPRLVVFRHSKHIRMENITVQNSPSWQ